MYYIVGGAFATQMKFVALRLRARNVCAPINFRTITKQKRNNVFSGGKNE